MQELLAKGHVALLKEGLAKSRLPLSHRWRQLAAASVAAAEAAEEIRLALAEAPVDEALLQAGAVKLEET